MSAHATPFDRSLPPSDTAAAFRTLGLAAAPALLDEESVERCRAAAGRLLPGVRPRVGFAHPQRPRRPGEPGPALRLVDVHQVSPAFAAVVRSGAVADRVGELAGVGGIEPVCCALWFHEPHTRGTLAPADGVDGGIRTDLDVYIALDPLSDRHAGIVVDLRLGGTRCAERAAARGLSHIGMRPGDALILAPRVPNGFSHNAGSVPLHVLHLGYRHTRATAPGPSQGGP